MELSPDERLCNAVEKLCKSANVDPDTTYKIQQEVLADLYSLSPEGVGRLAVSLDRIASFLEKGRK